MMNVINFAHGDFVMLAMYTAFVVWTVFGGGPAASVPIAALILATVGVLSYFLLVRHIMRGPMLAQILGTFGLALLLRYSVFWYFGANFKTLPDNILGPPFVFGEIRIDAPRLLAGTIGFAVTLLLHLLLTRTALGSRMLAVSEDATAAQLMGIRPERMQAVAWALGRGRDRHRRRADRDLLLHFADGGRDARHRGVRDGGVRRLRQRARRPGRGLADRRDRSALGLPDRPRLQGRDRLLAVRAGAVDAGRRA